MQCKTSLRQIQHESPLGSVIPGGFHHWFYSSKFSCNHIYAFIKLQWNWWFHQRAFERAHNLNVNSSVCFLK